MDKLIIVSFILGGSLVGFSQIKDTVYIEFDNHYSEMRKVDFTNSLQAGATDEKLKKSIDYFIEQMEPANGYHNEFNFTHANHPKKAYKVFGGKPLAILKSKKSFLEDKKVLDINFFKTTPYIQIAKTFEKENTWEQDVVIFIIDVDEIENDCIVLREVNFTRPVKE